jgi:hypothetical protein
MAGAVFVGSANMIPTINSLHRNHRRVDRKLARAELVLAAMKNGAALHLQLTQGGPVWTLTTGQQVTDSVARLAITSASVVGIDTGLFQGCLGQSWRWWSDDDR